MLEIEAIGEVRGLKLRGGGGGLKTGTRRIILLDELSFEVHR